MPSSISSTGAVTRLAKMGRDRVISRREIKALIAEGHTIVIYDNCVLRLDGWLEKHPGGKLPIQHMVGCDATDQIKV